MRALSAITPKGRARPTQLRSRVDHAMAGSDRERILTVWKFPTAAGAQEALKVFGKAAERDMRIVEGLA